MKKWVFGFCSIVWMTFVICACSGGGLLRGTSMKVSDALRAKPGEEVRVQGFLIIEPDGTAWLCNELLESYPPQCGEPSLTIEGLDPEKLSGLTSAEGMIWSDRVVELAGKIENGTLRVSQEPPP